MGFSGDEIGDPSDEDMQALNQVFDPESWGLN
jgi:hypothetical protein